MGNRFYQELNNINLLMTPQMLTSPSDLKASLTTEKSSFSGCISYRPVTAFSFFVDHFVWKEKPFGYHLTNLVLHIFVACLVFELAVLVLPQSLAAFWAAVLFAIHPIHSETVCGIGYRSDILSALFCVTAFLSFVWANKASGLGRMFFLLFSCLSWTVALFSKENAIVLPVLILFYDFWFLKKEPLKEHVKRRFVTYLNYCVIFIFFLITYFGIMRNPFYSQMILLNNNFWLQMGVAAKIHLLYLVAFILPWRVHVLPPLYVPGSEGLSYLLSGMLLVALSVLAFWGSVRSFAKRKYLVFSLFWFVVFSLPTSNLVFILNPFAFRFMYLPSCGLFLIAAYFLTIVFEKLDLKSRRFRAGKILQITIVGLCLALTLCNNAFFANSFVAAKEMIRNYPDASRAYWILGVEYFERGRLKEARANFLKYLNTPVRNPLVLNPKDNFAVYHMLGKCWIKDDLSKAEEYYKKTLRLNPDFDLAYVDLARCHLLKGDYEGVIVLAQKAIALNSQIEATYIYLLESYLQLGLKHKAGQIYRLIQERFNVESEVSKYFYERLKD